MDRVAPRQRGRDDPRTRSDRRVRARGPQRRHDPRHPHAHDRRSRIVPAAADAGHSHAHGPRAHGVLPDSRGEDGDRRRLHAQDGDRRVPRRGASRGDVPDRAADGRRRERARGRSPRDPAEALSAAVGVPVRDLVRPHLRQRQLSGRPREGEAARGLGSADEEPVGGARGGTPVRRRRVHLCRDLRDGSLVGDARGRLGMGLRADGNLGQGDRHHRRLAARPGTGD